MNGGYQLRFCSGAVGQLDADYGCISTDEGSKCGLFWHQNIHSRALAYRCWKGLNLGVFSSERVHLRIARAPDLFLAC